MIDDMPLPVSMDGAGDSSGEVIVDSENAPASGEERQGGRRRGRRGGRDRNRRRWKDREAQGGDSQAGDAPANDFSEPANASYGYDTPQATPPAPRQREREQVQAYGGGQEYAAASQQPEEPSGPPRRGWWRKILD